VLRRNLEGLQPTEDPQQAEKWAAWISKEKLLCTNPSLLCPLSPHPRDGERRSKHTVKIREMETMEGGGEVSDQS